MFSYCVFLKGDLNNLIDFYKEENKTLSENKVIDLTLQILKGLKELHSRSIIHRYLNIHIGKIVSS